MKKNYYLILFVVSRLLFSCTTPGDFSKALYIKDFRGFVNYTELHYRNYTFNDWEQSDRSYKSLQSRYLIIEPKLSPTESSEVDDLKGQYAAILTKHEAHRAKQELGHLYRQASSLFHHLSN